MGGYGSTRWAWHNKKNTVDDCLSFSIVDFNRKGLLHPGLIRSGNWIWRNAFSDECQASIGYELTIMKSYCLVQLYYTVTDWQGDKEDINYFVRLETTPCQFGGQRWWFICPLTSNGHDCKRRVGKLYLPPGGRYFGCRHCYDLTYRSSQESDKRVNALKGLEPLAILEGIKTGEIDPLMGFKALPDEIWR